MASPPDAPPAYSSLLPPPATANVDVTEEPPPNYGDASDDMAELLMNGSFEDETTRISFIQKVFAVKLVQLLIVAATMGIFKANDGPILYFMSRGYNHLHLTIVSALVFGLVMVVLSCTCRDARRLRNPFRHLLLVLQPVSFAFFVTMLAMSFDFLTPVLLGWLGYCGAMLVLLLYSVFALRTRLELAAKHGLVLAVFTQIVVYGISVPISNIDAFSILYPTVVFFLDLVYVLWDVELMTSKSYWAPMAPALFLDGVLNLHVDYYYIISSAVFPRIAAAVEGAND